MTEQLDQPPARILIVDDEPLNVDYLEQELESVGFVTETAADGLEALERVAAAPPDLVLLDVMMPRMDGISALRILKGDPDTRLIPVVLMTALNAVEDRVRGIEAGADAFLSKPVDDRVLLARIRTALSLKRTIDETVGELRSTSVHLERYGRQEREVAILAVEWRLREANLSDEAVGAAPPGGGRGADPGRRGAAERERLRPAHRGVRRPGHTSPVRRGRRGGPVSPGGGLAGTRDGLVAAGGRARRYRRRARTGRLNAGGRGRRVPLGVRGGRRGGRAGLRPCRAHTPGFSPRP
jgi:CheY-like chemotaxis protein